MQRPWLKKRLKELRSKGKSQLGLARLLDLPAPRIVEMINGTRNVHVREVPAMAAYLEMPEARLMEMLTGRKTPARPAGTDAIPYYGYVGAGDQVHPFDGDDAPADYVDTPPGLKNGAALVVRGHSMVPMFQEGDVLYFEQKQLTPEQAIGRECIVQVKDGPRLVKRLMRGSRKGRFHLVSLNPMVPPLEDQALVWAAKIRWVRRVD